MRRKAGGGECVSKSCVNGMCEWECLDRTVSDTRMGCPRNELLTLRSPLAPTGDRGCLWVPCSWKPAGLIITGTSCSCRYRWCGCSCSVYNPTLPCPLLGAPISGARLSRQTTYSFSTRSSPHFSHNTLYRDAAERSKRKTSIVS